MSDVALKIRHVKRQNANTIDLSKMNLESIPTEIYQLSSLTSINLSNNNITELDRNICNLPNLKELNLANNQITTIPIEILNLKDLINLKLTGNPIHNNLKNFDHDWRKALSNYFNQAGNDDYDYYEEDNFEKVNDARENVAGVEEEDIYKFEEHYEEKTIDVNQLKAKDDEIKSLKFTISQLEAELKTMRLRPTSAMPTNIKQEETLSNKRNWMDDNTKTTSKDVKTSFNDNPRISELESQLQKEILNNKRMKNEVDRLSQQLSTKTGGGDGFLKSI
jgi:Leucine-rich repeat (LRR) protein